MAPVRFGIFVPQGWILDLIDIEDPIEKYEAMSRVARTAERLGFDSIWLFDHFHTYYRPVLETTFECWTATAALARDTSRIRLGQMVTCNGYRNPALLAKMASTVDVLSHGRLDFGIGAGWYEHEYKAYGYEYPPTPGERLKMLREALQVIRAMWTEPYASFDGEHYKVSGAINEPKGVQKPHPPIWVGGESGPALRRTAQLGDAWYPIGTNPANPLDSLARFKAQVARLRKMTQEAGRKPDAVELALRCTAYGESVPGKAGDGERRLFAGKPAEIAADIKALRDMGVGHLDIGFGGATVEAMLGEMQKFRKDVLALV